MVIRIMGGLGNQMFQYAFYKGKGKTAFVETSYFLGKNSREFMLGIFPNIKMKTIPYICNILAWRGFIGTFARRCASKVKYIYFENMVDGYDKNLNNKKLGIIQGYYQDERYFKNYENDIRNVFEFEIKDEKLQSLISKLESDDYASIHIRRGDYLELNKMYGGICTTEYYKKAIEYILEKKPNSKFAVFSNDMQWVKENLRLKNALYINKNMFNCYEDWYDMCLMSHCHSNIIANSSFSWWGAWLNKHSNKIVICPNRWENTTPSRKMACAGWVEISGEKES